MPQLAVIPFLVVTVSLLIGAEFRSKRQLIYLFKPLSTLLVILVAALSLRMVGVDTGYTVGVLVGLILSLGGDVALVSGSPKAFRVGLGLFLLAHAVYAVAFTVIGGLHAADLISAGVLLALALVFYRYLEPGLGEMKGPVIFYIAVICIMINRAVSTFYSMAFAPAQAWLIAVGATLFWVSDLILAIARFRRPFRYHRFSLAFYYAGQLCIALSPAFVA